MAVRQENSRAVLFPSFFKKTKKSLSVFKNLTIYGVENSFEKGETFCDFLRMYGTAKMENQNFFQTELTESGFF